MRYNEPNILGKTGVTPEQFVKKWKAAALSEKSAAQQHFVDLCQLLGLPTPAEADPDGTFFTFEKGGATATGGRGWADVWKKGVFAWEYKGPGKDLQAAYFQLKKYADALENPPLLITSDTKRIEIHTNFTNTVKVQQVLELEDILDPAKRETLRAAFTEPEKLRPGLTRQQITKEAAEQFSALAHQFHAKGNDPHKVAHFLNRLIFCMFAEDIGLLPNKLFTRLANASVAHPEKFEEHAKQLFAGMSKGGAVAFEVIDWFNGGLFDDDSTLPLDREALKLLLKCAELDWSNIEPSIFGTLFERGLDPDKRSQQGAHYTDPTTIMKIVRPVIVDPLEREWEAERAELEKLLDRSKKTISEAAKKRFQTFLERLKNFRVLDPACGSGNFLYLSLRALKTIEKKVILEAEAMGLPREFPHVGPEAVLGIEVNPYAAELARVTIWIGEIQWMIENGFGVAKNPILKPLDQIECRDAILNDDGTDPEWPTADVIVGNPPFLGSQFMIRGLGEEYTNRLRHLYVKKLSGGTDLCAFWFIRAADAIEKGRACRAGLVATQSLRNGKNRQALEYTSARAEIFCAHSDEPWVNEGAAVRVSIICFSGAQADPRSIDGKAVSEIGPDLTEISATKALKFSRLKPLEQNLRVAYQGPVKVGPFDIPGDIARKWLAASNPHGKPNADVLRPWANGQDLARRPSDTWIVDFADMAESDAALYEAPFLHVMLYVKPMRDAGRREGRKRYWWRHGETVPALRRGLSDKKRYVATLRVSKHRLFVWLSTRVLPDSRLYAICREDDVTFGILQSMIHSTWTLATCSWHGVGNDPTYNAESVFATFPFPEGLTPNIPVSKFAEEPRAQRIATAAKRLNDLRESWLNPQELVHRVPEVVPGYPDRILPNDDKASAELKRRTLTNLYNANPAWLQHAHRELDVAVAAAYGWTWPMADEQILEKLVALNQERAKPTSQTASLFPADSANEAGNVVAPKKRPPRKRKASAQ